jgi:hypothetical protein
MGQKPAEIWTVQTDSQTSRVKSDRLPAALSACVADEMVLISAIGGDGLHVCRRILAHETH